MSDVDEKKKELELQWQWERMKIEHEQKIRAAERAHDRTKELAMELMAASGRDAQEATKVALAINGGAAVAVLAFAGAIAYKGGVGLGELTRVIASIGLFAVGVFFGAATAGCAYFANGFYGAAYHSMKNDWDEPYSHETDDSKRYLKWGRRFNWAGIILALLSLGVFVAGITVATIGIANLTFFTRSLLD